MSTKRVAPGQRMEQELFAGMLTDGDPLGHASVDQPTVLDDAPVTVVRRSSCDGCNAKT